MNSYLILSFLEEDKITTIQPHDDALLITLRIGDYDVKRVMVDDGSIAEIMYPELYKGLKLKPKDLMPYSSPLMSFNGKLVIPKGMIRLPISICPEIVEVGFCLLGRRGTDSSFVLLVNQTRWELISSDEEFVSSDRESVQLCVLNSYSIISNLCINCCLIKAQLLDPLSINSL